MKDWNTCCIYHVEIDELSTTFNNMQKVIDGFDYTYNCHIYGFIITNFTTTNPTSTNPTPFWINTLGYNNL
jgi:hypothetical protein